METELWQALEQGEPVYLVSLLFFLQPVYQTVAPFCHMTVPRNPPEQGKCLQPQGDRLQRRDMAEVTCNRGTDWADRLGGHRVMAFALHKDTADRTVVDRVHKVIVSAVQWMGGHR